MSHVASCVLQIVFRTGLKLVCITSDFSYSSGCFASPARLPEIVVASSCNSKVDDRLLFDFIVRFDSLLSPAVVTLSSEHSHKVHAYHYVVMSHANGKA